MIVMRGPDGNELYCEQVQYSYESGMWICKNIYDVEKQTWEMEKCILILGWHWDIAYEIEDPIDGS